MTIGQSIAGSVKTGAHPVVVAGSCHGTWQQSNDDGTVATNQSRFTPYNISSANVHWIALAVAGATRALVQARMSVNATACTGCSFALLGAYKLNTQQGSGDIGVPANQANFRYTRLDSNNIADSGTAITWAATSSITTSNTLADGTYYYSQLPTTTGYDCVGCEYVGIVITSAGAVTNATTGGTAMPMDVLILN